MKRWNIQFFAEKPEQKDAKDPKQQRKQKRPERARRPASQKKTGNKQGRQDSVNNLDAYDDDTGDKRQRQAKDAADIVRKLEISDSNPLSYYTKFTRFAEDAATLPFSLPVGAPISANLGGVQVKYTVAGIMRLCFTPTIGISRDFTSPINRSSTRFYTYLRANQKASANYDHQDITMMELALDAAYMFHAMCARIYKTAAAVTPINEYYVRSLLAAQGVSLQDVSKHMQDFRGWINQYAYNLGQFSMPAGITLFDRHRWMCGNYFTDSASSHAQTYIHVPTGFWKYDNTVPTGSQLTFVPYMNESTSGGKLQYTVDELMEIGNSLLNAIAGDEDFQYIAGDIYNFYGGDVYALPYLTENEVLVPIYDEVVLSQIENATIVGNWKSDPVISQNPDVNQGAIIFYPELVDADTFGSVPINFHKDSPSPGDVIEATRLTATYTKVSSTEVRLESCGTEVINWVDVFAINPTTLAPRFNTIGKALYIFEDSDTAAQRQNAMIDVLHLAQFDWAPQIWCMYKSGSSYTYEGQTWDVDNMQWVPNDYIALIHSACLWSLFEVGTNRTELT